MLTLMFVPQGYRGYTYVFMGDTVGYYCGSRFYMPELGRFLNADIYADTGTGVVGTNMFAYCNNNPVMFVDPEGESAFAAIAASLGVPVSVLMAASVLVILMVDVITGGKILLTFTEAIKLVIDEISVLLAKGKRKRTKMPSNLKKGKDTVKTPDTNPDEFKKKSDGSYEHKKTKWKYKKDPSGHRGPHWDVSPPNGGDGDYYNVDLDGRII